MSFGHRPKKKKQNHNPMDCGSSAEARNTLVSSLTLAGISEFLKYLIFIRNFIRHRQRVVTSSSKFDRHQQKRRSSRLADLITAEVAIDYDWLTNSMISSSSSQCSRNLISCLFCPMAWNLCFDYVISPQDTTKKAVRAEQQPARSRHQDSQLNLWFFLCVSRPFLRSRLQNK